MFYELTGPISGSSVHMISEASEPVPVKSLGPNSQPVNSGCHPECSGKYTIPIIIATNIFSFSNKTTSLN